MNKKSILVLVVVIVIVVIAGYVSYNHFGSADNQVKVGAATFTLPEGFHVGTIYKNYTNITNGYDRVYIKDCGSDNISKYIEKHVDYKSENNTKVKIKNLTVNDTVIYKCYPVNHTSDVCYWFEHDGDVYLLRNWKASNNFEKIVTDLVINVK